MAKLTVVVGEGADVIIRTGGRGSRRTSHRLVRDITGDILFIVNGVAGPYRFEPDIPFAEKHEILIDLESGEYRSYKTKGNVEFVCRGLQSAGIKWSMAYCPHVYITVGKIVLATLRPSGRLGEATFTTSPGRGLHINTVFSEEYLTVLATIAKQYRI